MYGRRENRISLHSTPKHAKTAIFSLTQSTQITQLVADCPILYSCPGTPKKIPFAHFATFAVKKSSIQFPQTHRRTNNFRKNINRSQRRPARKKKLPDGSSSDRRRGSCRDSRRGLRFMCHGSCRQRWGGRKRNRRHTARWPAARRHAPRWSAALGSAARRRWTRGILPIDRLPTRPPSRRRPGRRARRRRLTLLVPTREQGDQRADD
jgi:hypothetical protein